MGKRRKEGRLAGNREDVRREVMEERGGRKTNRQWGGRKTRNYWEEGERREAR